MAVFRGAKGLAPLQDLQSCPPRLRSDVRLQDPSGLESPGLTRSSQPEPSYLQSHHGRHSCQQGRLGQGRQERQERLGVQQGRSHHGHPGRGEEQRPGQPQMKGPSGAGGAADVAVARVRGQPSHLGARRSISSGGALSTR